MHLMRNVLVLSGGSYFLQRKSTQLTFTFLKLTIATLEKGVKYVQC